MNKIKYLFLMILCAGLMSGAAAINISAQIGGKVSAAGKKPLKQSDINKLIEFYEWAFQTEFTSEQRARFQQYTENEFRSDPNGSRATIDDITVTLPKILAADADLQSETRKNFLAAFLPDARKNTDENSQLLVSIYDDAQGNQSNVAANNSNDGDESNETEVNSNISVGNISALAGTWVWARTGTSYANSTTGVYAGGNGSRHTYKFGANGTVEYTGIMNVMTGGCNMQIFRAAKGRASLSGTTLTINWSPANFSRDDSCSPSKNYKKTMPAETETVQIQMKNSSGRKELCMTGKDETCFDKQ